LKLKLASEDLKKVYEDYRQQMRRNNELESTITTLKEELKIMMERNLSKKMSEQKTLTNQTISVDAPALSVKVPDVKISMHSLTVAAQEDSLAVKNYNELLRISIAAQNINHLSSDNQALIIEGKESSI
jgi:hypothetical protein